MKKKNINHHVLEHKTSCIITIPVYKEKLSKAETFSLRMLEEKLNDYDIVFATSKRLNTDYLKLFSIERFDNCYFKDIAGYNRLMLSKEFYERFSTYDYLFIYQLDGLVFKNRLSYFTKLDYDYIGAPWLHGRIFGKHNGKVYSILRHILSPVYNVKTVYVGNGGISLRRVSAFIKALSDPWFNEWIPTGINEDIIYAYYGMTHENLFKVAPVSEALKFSFEKNVEECFRANGNKIPFACHAWQKYNSKFWQKYLRSNGYDMYDME